MEPKTGMSSDAIRGGLTPPDYIPEAKVSVDTRTKLKDERK